MHMIILVSLAVSPFSHYKGNSMSKAPLRRNCENRPVLKGLLPKGIVKALLGALATLPAPSLAATAPAMTDSRLTYADLADLTDASNLVIRAQIRQQATVPPDRAADLPAGWTRLYVEARTVNLLAGRAPIGEDIHYLADVPLDAKGRPPRLKGKAVILFAREVPGKPGAIQLAGRGAQLTANAVLEQRLQPILTEFFAADAPPRITDIRDVLWVPGNLAGESETQMFLSTRADAPALISVLRRPGQPPVWGVSWSELVDQVNEPPSRETIVWYRLACFLPPRLPAAAQISREPVARQRAEADYQFVRGALGECPRSEK